MKSLEKLHRDFGAFFPTGHMVVAFQQPQDARQVVRELEELEHHAVEALELSPQEMAEFAEKNLQQAGFIADMGTSLATVQSFLDTRRPPEISESFEGLGSPSNPAEENRSDERGRATDSERE